ncbi:MAG: ion transporter [Chitinophagaceae bacterium]|jgi:voltage-gated potassium channel|nr:ion transporter [Chitinophagaceae bacterium]
MPAPTTKNWREKLFSVIFEADTKAGKLFDIILLVMILLSIGIVMLQSVPAINKEYGQLLLNLEWFITILFTLEYCLRLIAVKKPLNYAGSFYGLVDLLAILPTYLSLILPQSRFLLVIRALRLMRAFRVFELSHFVQEGVNIVQSLKASTRRILVFLAFIFLLSMIMGALIFVVESPQNDKFSSIPQSVYWSIVTITTVGYGDISPITPLGKLIASFIMLLGYAMIAVPTGIVTVEMSRRQVKAPPSETRSCPGCGAGTHAPDAKFCKYCGHEL